jgi:2-aminoethylphosphonate-pyruvate transaminase
MKYNIRYKSFTPGQCSPNELWRETLSNQYPYQLGTKFHSLIKKIQTQLTTFHVASTKHSAYLLSSSGTGALDLAIGSLGKTKCTIVVNGHFGERLVDIANYFGLEINIYKIEKNTIITQKDEKNILNQLIKHKSSVLVAVHTETSIGLTNNIYILGKVAKQTNSLFIVDGISSTGSENISIKDCNIDCFVGVPYKCLLSPSGMSFIIANKTYLDFASNSISFSLDWKKLISAHNNGQCLWSPMTYSLLVLSKVLDLRMENKELFFKKLQLKAKNIWKKFEREGIAMLGLPESRNPCFTVIYANNNAINIQQKILQHCKIEIATGLGNTTPELLRISHYPDSVEQDYEMLAKSIATLLAE